MNNPATCSAFPCPELFTPPHTNSLAGEGRRRWTTGELAEIVSALATLRTNDLAQKLGVHPKALHAALRRNGISLRALRQQARKQEASQISGLTVRRSSLAPSASFGAAALDELDDESCRWPLGDPAEPGFAFCSAKIEGRGSYCTSHLAQAFLREDGHEK
ncbi:MAG: GcrA family cell cycle regulator [Rhodomicrobium sp.]